MFIPEPGRGTLCISSQIGCALDCSFCATGPQGFNRNLTAAEIIGQVWLANRELGHEPDGERSERRADGHGRAARQLRNVLPPCELMLDDQGIGLSRRRVTLSTSARAADRPARATIARRARRVAARADRRLRDQLVPINRVHPIAELMAACGSPRAPARPQHDVRVRVLEGVNDGDADARQLGVSCADVPVTLNVIPFNPHPAPQFRLRRRPTIDARFVSAVAPPG